MARLRDDIGTRMKDFYEQIPKTKLMRRCPVAIRIDGKAFHTYTRNFKRPFDSIFMRAMQETMKYLCENIQGCVLGYTQSDEITLILVDYEKINSSAWFDYEVQKLCSVSASMATMGFNQVFARLVQEVKEEGTEDPKYIKVLDKACETGAMFDARCFNIPKEEVTNLVYWRQLDASRNSIQMVGHANFSQKQMHGKSTSDIQDMLMLEKNINWNDFPVACKRGSCCIRGQADEAPSRTDGSRTENSRGWVIDNDIPIFKGEEREYVDRLIYIGEQ